MSINPKDGKLLYHLTALSNLKSIFSNGLSPRSEISNFVDVADLEIIEHRIKYDLNKCIPFHFFAGTPFAGAVQIANKEEEFVYITILREFAKKNNFKIIPSHPLSYKGNSLTYDQGVVEINWGLIEKRDYSDHECKEACMAECLSEITISPSNFYIVFTKTEEIKQEVERIYKNMNKGNPGFSVLVNKAMFK